MMKHAISYLWTIPFLSFLGGYYVMSTLYTNKTIPTPSVVGMQLNQAVRLLSDQQLNVRILAEKEDADLPAGTIISQNPPAKSLIKPNQSIFLVVSTTPQPTHVPRLIGCTEAEIEQIAQKQNIRYKIYPLECKYPANTCCAQWPAPGSILDTHPLILYMAQNKHKPILMPDLRGHSVPAVADFLTNHDMVPELMHHPSVPDGHICSSACIVTDQRPIAGSLVPRENAKQLHIHLQVEERQ